MPEAFLIGGARTPVLGGNLRHTRVVGADPPLPHRVVLTMAVRGWAARARPITRSRSIATHQN